MQDRLQEQTATDDQGCYGAEHDGCLPHVETICAGGAERRQNCDQGDRGKILEQQDGECRAAVTGRQLFFLGQHLQHERR